MKFFSTFFFVTAVMSVVPVSNAKCAQVAERCNPKSSPPVECCLADCFVPDGEAEGYV